jgi:purine nucleoside permease
MQATAPKSTNPKTALAALTIAAILAGCASPPRSPTDASTKREVKVMIITMFAPEGKVWLDRLGPWDATAVPGLSPDYPEVHCNQNDVCVMTTGMGHTNAAASTMALAFSDRFDLRKTYFLIAGIAGIDPMRGTIGSTAWAKYLVDFGPQWELDAREKPANWPSGFTGINTKGPNEKPPLDYRTEVFALDATLADTAHALSRNVTLADSREAKTARAKFRYAPANQPPAVIQCDTLAGDTWWSGRFIGERARTWTRQLTDGRGVYCTTQQEDNATFEALKRAANVQRVDVSRVAVLRAGSDFDRPYKGQTAVDNLLNYAAQGGFAPAIENLYRTGNPFVQEVVTHWSTWRDGTPKR